jgi:hypothetical protein
MFRINREKLGREVQYLKNRSNDSYKSLAGEIGVSDAVLCRVALAKDIAIDFRSFELITDYLKIDPVSMLDTSDDYLCLSRLPDDKRKAVLAVLHGK